MRPSDHVVGVRAFAPAVGQGEVDTGDNRLALAVRLNHRPERGKVNAGGAEKP